MGKLVVFVLTAAALFAAGCSLQSGNDSKLMEAWPVPIEIRINRDAYRPDTAGSLIAMEGLAGELLSAQVAVRSNGDIDSLHGTVSALLSESDTIQSAAARLRYGAFVPVVETMSWAADPLLETGFVDVEANQAQPVWLSLEIPRSAAPGVYEGQLSLECGDGPVAAFDLRVEVLPAVLPETGDWVFNLFMWQDPTPIARAHGVEVWSEEHWELLERYAANMAEHGIKSLATHIIHDPWHGVRGWPSDEMVIWNYPGEYEPGRADEFDWDFTIFDRYVGLMLKAGVDRKIDLFSLVMGPWIIPDAHIRYRDTVSGQYRTITMDVGDPRWYDCWRRFLPVLREHLIERGWYDISVLGFDEKPEKIMRIIFDLITEVAPDFKVCQAGGFAGDERNRGIDLALGFQNISQEAQWESIRPVVEQYHQDPDKFVTFYTACSPWYPNTFLFSTLRESRLMPWIAARYGFDGYARWAISLYPEDVWNNPRYGWASGDMFFTWPGPEGPLDSMRWEVLRQGIQDYETLQIAMRMAEQAGREDLLGELESAVESGGTIDNCGALPVIEDARRRVNDVIRELADG